MTKVSIDWQHCFPGPKPNLNAANSSIILIYPQAGGTEPKLEGADLEGANLRQADLTGAKLDQVMLEGARYNPDTKWPEDFDPTTTGTILEENPE